MGRSRNIDSDLWDRDWFVAATNEQRVAFMWAFSNASIEPSGLYRPPFDATSRTLGFDVRAAVKEINRRWTKLVYFERLDLLWVPNFLRHNNYSGRFVIGAVSSLLKRTQSPSVIVPWIAYNRGRLRGNEGAMKVLRDAGWKIGRDGFGFDEHVWPWMEDDSEESIGACLMLVESEAEEPALTLSVDSEPPEPEPSGGRRSASRWPDAFPEDKAVEVFAYWCKLFRRHPKLTKLSDKRKAKLRARAGEGVTWELAKLAVFGCYADGKRWPERLTTPSAHEFELIFRNRDKMMEFVEVGRAELRERGREVDEYGRIVERGHRA